MCTSVHGEVVCALVYLIGEVVCVCLVYMVRYSVCSSVHGEVVCTSVYTW